MKSDIVIDGQGYKLDMGSGKMSPPKGNQVVYTTGERVYLITLSDDSFISYNNTNNTNTHTNKNNNER